MGEVLDDVMASVLCPAAHTENLPPQQTQADDESKENGKNVKVRD